MWMAELRGLSFVAWLTFRRQVFARKSIVAGVLIVMLTMATAIWSQRMESRYDPEIADQAMKQIDFLTNTVVVRLFVLVTDSCVDLCDSGHW